MVVGAIWSALNAHPRAEAEMPPPALPVGSQPGVLRINRFDKRVASARGHFSRTADRLKPQRGSGQAPFGQATPLLHGTGLWPLRVESGHCLRPVSEVTLTA